MFPTLFHFGPFTLHTYGAFVAAGFLLAYGWSVKMGQRVHQSTEMWTDLSWVALLSGLAGARLFYIFAHWTYYVFYPADILKIWEGGLVWHGGLLFGVAAAFIMARRKKWPWGHLLDTAAPGILLGQGVGRLGCFFAGCCYGKPWEGPWAVVFKNTDGLAPLGVSLHPTQLYESAVNLLIFAVLGHASYYKKIVVGKGHIAAWALGLHSTGRLLVEFFRGDDRGPLWAGYTSSQWTAHVCLLAVLLWSLRQEQKKRD